MRWEFHCRCCVCFGLQARFHCRGGDYLAGRARGLQIPTEHGVAVFMWTHLRRASHVLLVGDSRCRLTLTGLCALSEFRFPRGCSRWILFRDAIRANQSPAGNEMRISFPVLCVFWAESPFSLPRWGLPGGPGTRAANPHRSMEWRCSRATHVLLVGDSPLQANSDRAGSPVRVPLSSVLPSGLNRQKLLFFFAVFVIFHFHHRTE